LAVQIVWTCILQVLEFGWCFFWVKGFKKHGVGQSMCFSLPLWGLTWMPMTCSSKWCLNWHGLVLKMCWHSARLTWPCKKNEDARTWMTFLRFGMMLNISQCKENMEVANPYQSMRGSPQYPSIIHCLGHVPWKPSSYWDRGSPIDGTPHWLCCFDRWRCWNFSPRSCRRLVVTDVNGQEKSGEKPAKHTLWKFNIAMENGPFIDDLAIKRLVFHSYVSLPEGR